MSICLKAHRKHLERTFLSQKHGDGQSFCLSHLMSTNQISSLLVEPVCNRFLLVQGVTPDMRQCSLVSSDAA